MIITAKEKNNFNFNEKTLIKVICQIKKFKLIFKKIIKIITQMIALINIIA